MGGVVASGVRSACRYFRHRHLPALRRRPSSVALLLLLLLLCLLLLNRSPSTSDTEEGEDNKETKSEIKAAVEAIENAGESHNLPVDPDDRKQVKEHIIESVQRARAAEQKQAEAPAQNTQEPQEQHPAEHLEEQHEEGHKEVEQKVEENEAEEHKEVVVDGQQEDQNRGDKGDEFLASMLLDYKKILFWNDLYKQDDFRFGLGQLPFLTANCPVNKCYTTSDRTLFKYTDVDAVIWHVGSKDLSFPPQRSNHTMYVFFSIESPTIKKQKINYKRLNGVFNWTNTYRRDSDFRFPYGDLREVPPAEREETFAKNWALGRPNKVAWFVSNCHTTSNRSTLAETIAQYINVDIYGWCGTLSCDKAKIDDCGDLMEQNYKFYFAFENSLCLDYITEKIFRTLKFNTVPIVYGLGYDSYNFPPNSYIDVMDFESIEDLGKYLQYLTYNDTAYNEYFSWKNEYEIMPMWDFHKNNFCEMCRRLHEMYPVTLTEEFPHKATVVDNSTAYRKVYEDFVGWWVHQGQCVLPRWNPQMAAFIKGESKTDILEKKENEKRGVMNIAKRENLFIL